MIFRVLLVPLAGVLIALSVLMGGRSGQVMAIVSAILFGGAVLLTLTGA